MFNLEKVRLLSLALFPSSESFKEGHLMKDILTIAKGVRNGIVYGAKVRLPHAFVMTFLFKSGSFISKIKEIVKLTIQHSWNLGCFVALYKSIIIALFRMGLESPISPFIAGSLGGLLIFSKENQVNTQIVLYLTSRVLSALIKWYLAHSPSALLTDQRVFAIQASLVWGAVMMLFAAEPLFLQKSLQSSMKYLYLDGEKWNDLWEFLFLNE